MSTKIFVNLAVKDLSKSIEFFKKLGYTFNAQFTDETATCMIISDTIYVMLLTETKFKSFTPKQICDTTKYQEAFICLSADSKEAVDGMIKKAVAAGGKTWKGPEDHGFMYGHEFEDLDGHVWEIMWMDPNFVQK
jgi:predicted lactoylglutathione lyase